MRKKKDHSTASAAPADMISKYEVANLCGVSHHTVSGWAKRKVIPSYRVGGARRYRRSEIETFLAKGRRPAVTPSTPTTKGKE